jgi:hypothetical protein
MNILNNLNWDALTHIKVKGKNNEQIDPFDLTDTPETHAAEQKQKTDSEILKTKQSQPDTIPPMKAWDQPNDANQAEIEEWYQLVSSGHNKEKTRGAEALGESLANPDKDIPSPDETSGGGDDTDLGGDAETDDEFEIGGDDFEFGGNDDGEGNSGSSSFGGTSDALLIINEKPGQHPFEHINGRELLTEKIQELRVGINEAIEASARVPTINSVMVNNLMKLKNEAEKLLDIVYMVPLEDVMIRYTLCVQSYDLQVRGLKNAIEEIVAAD